MNFIKFINEVNSIKNPEDKDAFLSTMIDRKMTFIERKYVDKSINYLTELKVEMKAKDLPLVAKSLALLAKDGNTRLIMILDKLSGE